MTTTQVLEAGQAQHSHWLIGPYDAATANCEVSRIPDFYKIEALAAFGTNICEVAALPVEPVVLMVAQSPARW